ncbi:hypothetical protein Tco_0755014 [Tanacetum coccineum]
MSPTQALKSIQVMADHSHSWYDEATTRKSISDSLDNVDTKNLKENIHTIQKAQEDEGDMDDGWDITIKDIKRLRQILIHTLPNLEPMVQPYMLRGPACDEIVHITPLDDDYVAPATSPILEKHLNKFGEEIYDITRVAEKADGNLVNDVKELSDIIKTYDFETFI